MVIAIIGVLASMLLPVLSNARDAARNTACLNNERQQSMAILEWASDRDDYAPPSGGSNGNGIGQRIPLKGSVNSAVASIMVTQNYMQDREIFRCPSASEDAVQLGKGGYTNQVHYRYMQDLVGDGFDATTLKPTFSLTHVSVNQISGVKKPAATLLFVDGVHFGDTTYTGTDPSGPLVSRVGNLSHSHGHAANVAWVDGHVEATTKPFRMVPSTNLPHTAHFYTEEAWIRQ